MVSMLITSLALGALAMQNQDEQGEIRVGNVCVGIVSTYEYTIVSNIDYFQVNISKNEVSAHVYIGYNPKIVDENRKWQSRDVISQLDLSKVVALSGSQSGQYLGVPVPSDGRYFHIWFDYYSASNKHVKDIVRFCE